MPRLNPRRKLGQEPPEKAGGAGDKVRVGGVIVVGEGEGAGEAVVRGARLAGGAAVGVAAGVIAGGGSVGSGVSAQAASASTSSTPRPSRRSRCNAALRRSLSPAAAHSMPVQDLNVAEKALVRFGPARSKLMTGNSPDLSRAPALGLFCTLQGIGSRKSRIYWFCPPLASLCLGHRGVGSRTLWPSELNFGHPVDVAVFGHGDIDDIRSSLAVDSRRQLISLATGLQPDHCHMVLAERHVGEWNVVFSISQRNPYLTIPQVGPYADGYPRVGIAICVPHIAGHSCVPAAVRVAAYNRAAEGQRRRLCRLGWRYLRWSGRWPPGRPGRDGRRVGGERSCCVGWR
jgi:hypothetical protein